MALQSTVNVDQGFGVQGSFYDDSPRRVAPYAVTSGTPVVEVNAFGVMTLTGLPTENDVFVIGTQSYRLRDTLAQAFDVQIGATAAATADSIAKAINADGVAGTDYFAGTTANLASSAALTDTAEVTFTAIFGGVVGNIVIFTESMDNTTITPTGGFLTGGVDAFANSALVGNAFTTDASNRLNAKQGGSTMFVGILVNGKHYTHSGLDATLVVENGKIGELATMGHIVIKSKNSVSVGFYAFYETATGDIYGYVGSGGQSGKTIIDGARFIFVDATAPAGLAVLSLTNA
jgi:hypothetical protein